RPHVLEVEQETAKVIAAAGCLAAALAFDSRDYMRRAWLLGCSCVALLLIRDSMATAPIANALSKNTYDAVPGTLAIVANGAWVLVMVLLTRAWTVAGLDDPSSRKRRWLLVVAGTALGLTFTAFPLVRSVSALLHGSLSALIYIASDLGDTLSL